MLCTFSALHHNSVYVVLVWTTAGGAAIEALVNMLLGGIALSKQSSTALLISFCAGGELPMGHMPQEGCRGHGQHTRLQT
jgi:hypothetical protein